MRESQVRALEFPLRYGRPISAQVDELLDEAEARSTRLDPDDVLLTVQDVADALRLSPKTVASGMRSGRIPGFQIEGRWRCSRSALRAYVKERSGG